MAQQGQVFRLRSRAGETPLWAYRYRVSGRGSRRVQRGGFASEEDARAALERALEKLRRENGIGRTLTLAEFVDQYFGAARGLGGDAEEAALPAHSRGRGVRRV
jgi:hypothetical protein